MLRGPQAERLYEKEPSRRRCGERGWRQEHSSNPCKVSQGRESLWSVPIAPASQELFPVHCESARLQEITKGIDPTSLSCLLVHPLGWCQGPVQ